MTNRRRDSEAVNYTPRRSPQEDAQAAVEDFRQSPLGTNEQRDLHHRVVDRHSLEQISLIAADDMEKRIANGDYNGVEEDLKRLRDTGANYRPQDEPLAERMSFHDQYRGDRLKEAFLQDAGLQWMPSLEALEQDNHLLETLVSFTSQLPEGDGRRLIDSITAGYAVTEGFHPPEWQASMAESAARIAAAVEKITPESS